MSRIPQELEAEMTPGVKAFVLSLLDRLEKAEATIEKLTPQNSSIAPRTVHPHTKPKRKPAAKKRKRGGQKAHRRHHRDLVSSEDCTNVTVWART
ncbi:MAG: hypothetical protein D6753_16095 [Planctomycetota bacterium]|nr:MAG: hypothetical protein D6753_16095 [Planctomycetota bacterium]